MTLDQLAEFEKAATPWPWEQTNNPSGLAVYVPPVNWRHHDFHMMLTKGDAAFIAAMRNAAPQLIAVAKAAKDLCQVWDDIANAVEDYGSLCPEWRPSGKLSLKEALAALEAWK